MSQYLIFCLQNTFYAIKTCHIVQVVLAKDMVIMENLPSDVKGMIKLGEKLIPVVDTKKRWGKESTNSNANGEEVVIMKIDDHEIGWLVDKVKGTIYWDEEDFSEIEWGPCLNPNVEIKKAFIDETRIIGILSQHAFLYE